MDVRALRYFVAVAEERNVGRAATRLSMTQPPLSRVIRALERELGVELFARSPQGMELTAAGTVLYREARPIVDRFERVPMRVAAAVGDPTIAVGTCGDMATQVGSRLITEFRRQHPEVELTLHETEISDPTAGLRNDLVDVALTRRPFDETGIEVRVLRRDPMGVVLLRDDPLAAGDSLSLSQLGQRRWNVLPEGADQAWSAYWNFDGDDRDGRRVVHTIHESIQAVLWSNGTTFATLDRPLPDGLVNVPLTDKAPSELIVAWKRDRSTPAVKAFVDVAVAVCDAHT